MSQHDTLTQALQDAASSLETISRLAGKAAHPNGDETCMGTFPEVRGYATSRAAVARAALSATQPAQAAQSVPGVNKAVQLIHGMTKEQFAYVHHCALEVDAAKAETARLRDTPPAQAAADARDAERYRYLRNRVPSEVLGQLKRAAGCWIDCEDDDGVLTLLTGHDADAAIDAAIAASGRQE